MKENSSRIQKVCSFYVSNMHFATMILPYISKQLEENIHIITFFENNYTTNIELVLSKITINEETKKELFEINWKKTKIDRYINAEKILKNNLKKNEKYLIIVNGSENYINIVNGCIDRYTQKNHKNIKTEDIKIMNFFEVRKF